MIGIWYGPDAPTLLRQARRKSGLSQRRLAELSGVPQPTIAAIERGRQDPRFATIKRLLAACGYGLDLELPLGEGVDRTLIDETLRLSTAERAKLATQGARVLGQLKRARRVG